MAGSKTSESWHQYTKINTINAGEKCENMCRKILVIPQCYTVRHMSAWKYGCMVTYASLILDGRNGNSVVMKRKSITCGKKMKSVMELCVLRDFKFLKRCSSEDVENLGNIIVN